MSTPGDPQTLVYLNTVATNVDFVAVIVFLYDYLLTFKLEVDVVWRAKWNTMKVLYLVQRYLPFVDIVGWFFYNIFVEDITDTACHREFAFAGWMFAAGMGVSEIILTIRTWAVWGCSRKLLYGIGVFFLVTWAPTFTFLGIYVNSMKFEPSPFPDIVGCWLTEANPILFIGWVLLVVYEGGLLVLMAMRAVVAWREGTNRTLFNVIFRDGMIYYIYMFALSFANIIILLAVPHALKPFLPSLERSVHSALTSRVVLQMRSQLSPESGRGRNMTELSKAQSFTQIQFREGARGSETDDWDTYDEHLEVEVGDRNGEPEAVVEDIGGEHDSV